jgi:hypothetical protein
MCLTTVKFYYRYAVAREKSIDRESENECEQRGRENKNPEYY